MNYLAVFTGFNWWIHTWTVG